MKKPYILILLIIASSVIVLFVLKKTKTNEEDNGFTRSFEKPNIKLRSVKEYKTSSFDFVSQTDSTIVVHFFSDKLNLYSFNPRIDKTDTIKLKFPKNFDAQAYRIHKEVLGKDCYVMNAYGDIAILKADESKYYKLNILRPDRIKIISPNTLIVRGTREVNGRRKRELAKLELSNPVKLTKEYKFPNVANNFFSNDGILHYDKLNNKVFYMYFYKGGIVCLDTNLNLLYTSKTIDTVRYAKIETQSLEKKGTNGDNYTKIIQSRPPKAVNIYFTVNRQKLYIISKLKADNESVDIADEKQVIDVYNTDNGKYLYSFYLPKYKNLKLRQFLISNGKLIALFGQYMVFYDFSG